MPSVQIDEKGCRSCTMCADICPVDVFALESNTQVASVAHEDNCVGCFSCHYLCPSQCIKISDTEIQRPFYRIEENVAFIQRFLKADTTTSSLETKDWDEAYEDISMTIISLSQAIQEMLGRGLSVLGRNSGSLAAAHLPEIYEENYLGGVLQRLQERFEHSFDFAYQIEGEEIELRFQPCGLHSIVTNAGETVGQTPVCQIFHDYMAGLIGAYSGVRYQYKLPQISSVCIMRLTPM